MKFSVTMTNESTGSNYTIGTEIFNLLLSICLDDFSDLANLSLHKFLSKRLVSLVMTASPEKPVRASSAHCSRHHSPGND